MSLIAESIIDLIGNTPLIRLNMIKKSLNLKADILAKAELFNPLSSAKDRAALYMIEYAEKNGILKPGGTIIEPTSGKTGVGLAFISTLKGYKLILTMPESMSIERRKLLKQLGAEIILTPASEGMSGAIKKAQELLNSTDNAFMPNQFGNKANALAHKMTTGPEIIKQTEGNIDFFVAGVGTGGTITGVGECLKELNKDIKIVAVEPFTSAVLSGEKSGAHGLQGIGAGFVPDVLNTEILDDVIKAIRASKNKVEAKDNLVKLFDFSELQAEAIVMLQLYRLTNTDVTLLEDEMKNLNIMVNGLQSILDNEEVLKNVMKDELRKIKKEYALSRKTDIKEEITEIKIDTKEMISKEDVIVTITKDGYIKRTSVRSYQASNDEATVKDGDYLLGLYELNTLDVLLLFTNLGNYLYIPVHLIPSAVWKDLGKHVSNIVKLEQEEEIINVIPIINFDTKMTIVIGTRNGMIKKTNLEEFKSSRYSKPICCMKLKDNDKVIDAFVSNKSDIFISTSNGYGLWFSENEIPTVGIKASGVKAINLKDDTVASISNFNLGEAEYISVITEKGTGKRVKISEFDKSSRAKRGLMILREVKTNPYKVLKSFIIDSKKMVGLKGNDIKYIKNTELPIVDRYSTGSIISKEKLRDAFKLVELEERKSLNFIFNTERKEKEIKNDKVSLKEIDDRLLTIEDFLNSD